MRFLFVVAAVLIAVPALARKDKAPAPQAPTPPVIAAPDMGQPQPGSMFNQVHARQTLGQYATSRQPGDIITVLLVEQTSTAMDAGTETKSSSSTTAGVGALFGLEGALALGGGDGKLSVSATRDGSFNGSGSTGRGSRIDSVVSCTITDVVQPRRDYAIWCSKQVKVNRETQWVVLTGRVRSQDVSQQNTIPSNLVAHAQIEVTGRGVVADKQKPGLLVRILDAIWPF